MNRFIRTLRLDTTLPLSSVAESAKPDTGRACLTNHHHFDRPTTRPRPCEEDRIPRRGIRPRA